MRLFLIFSTLALTLFARLIAAQGGVTITASALGQANLRASASIDSALVGEIVAGVDYPVIGRSELYPWLLLGERGSGAPLGWVYETLVTVRGDMRQLPFSSADVSAMEAPQASATAQIGASATPTLAQDSAAFFGVKGEAQGEVNIRYGPGVDYPRAGVAVAGQRFDITGYHTQFPWLRIAYESAPNGSGWIARDLLRIDGDIFATPAISATVFNLPRLTATPSMVSSDLSPALRQLADNLWALMLEAGFDPQTSRFGALSFIDLETGESFSFGGDIAFSGTSINKIAILAAVYAMLERPPSLELAEDIANTMICSENVATNRLLSLVGDGNAYLGAEAVSAFLANLGFNRSFITAPFTTIGKPEPPPKPIALPQTDADQQKAGPDLTNQMTAPDISALLAAVYECAYNESGVLIDALGSAMQPRECRQMLHVMSGNTVDALLKAGVPADTRTAHKHGWIADTHGNAALFFTPGRDYVIVMMLHQPQWLNFQESLPVIAEAGRRVYNHFNSAAPMSQIRDGFIPAAGDCNFKGSSLALDLTQSVWDG